MKLIRVLALLSAPAVGEEGKVTVQLQLQLPGHSTEGTALLQSVHRSKLATAVAQGPTTVGKQLDDELDKIKFDLKNATETAAKAANDLAAVEARLKAVEEGVATAATMTAAATTAAATTAATTTIAATTAAATMTATTTIAATTAAATTTATAASCDVCWKHKPNDFNCVEMVHKCFESKGTTDCGTSCGEFPHIMERCAEAWCAEEEPGQKCRDVVKKSSTHNSITACAWCEESSISASRKVAARFCEEMELIHECREALEPYICFDLIKVKIEALDEEKRATIANWTNTRTLTIAALGENEVKTFAALDEEGRARFSALDKETSARYVALDRGNNTLSRVQIGALRNQKWLEITADLKTKRLDATAALHKTKTDLEKSLDKELADAIAALEKRRKNLIQTGREEGLELVSRAGKIHDQDDKNALHDMKLLQRTAMFSQAGAVHVSAGAVEDSLSGKDLCS